MSRFNLQKHLAGWKQVCGQAKDGLHPTDKLKSIISDAGLCTSSNYMSAYCKTGVLINYRDASGRKGKIRISDKFLTKGNRESMILEYSEIIKRGRHTDNDDKQEIADQLAQAIDEVRDPIQQNSDDILEALCVLDSVNLNKDELSSIIDILKKYDIICFEGDKADKFIIACDLIVEACK